MHSALATGVESHHLLTAFSQEPSQVFLQGLTPASGAYLLANLFRQLQRPFLLVSPNGEGHETFLKDLAFFLGAAADPGAGPGARLLLFPGHEVLPFRELSFDSDISCARMAAAYVALTAPQPFFMVAPAMALRQKLPPAERVRNLLAYVLPGENLERQGFLQHLLDGGYARRPVVEEKGEFSVRGGIIDLFPPLYEQPVRLEFWGDEVESIRRFDPATQRSLGNLDELVVLPASEVVLDGETREHALARRKRRQDPQFWENIQEGRHFPRIERQLEEFYDRPQTLWDLLPPETVVVAWDPMSLARELKKVAEDTAHEPQGWLDQVPWEERLGRFSTVFCPLLPWGHAHPEKDWHYRVEKNDGLARELAEAGTEAGRLVPAPTTLSSNLTATVTATYNSSSRLQSSKIAASRIVVSMLLSSLVCTPRGKMIGREAGILIVSALT